MTYFYYLGTLDYFDGLIPFPEFVKKITKRESNDYGYDLPYMVLDEFKKVLRGLLLESFFHHSPWEGDISFLYVGGIPSVDNHKVNTDIFVIFKQDNNGSTFLASPHPFRHLSCANKKITNYDLEMKAAENTDKLIEELFTHVTDDSTTMQADD